MHTNSNQYVDSGAMFVTMRKNDKKIAINAHSMKFTLKINCNIWPASKVHEPLILVELF